MKLLVAVYAAAFVTWGALEIRDLRRSGYPTPALVAEALVNLFLVAGLVSYLIGFQVPVRPLWMAATPIAAGAAVALRILAFKNEEADLELSAEHNDRAHLAALVVVLLFVAPGVYLTARVAFPEGLEPAAAFAVGLSIVLGVAVGRLVPRFKGVFRSEQERELVDWLRTPFEFGRPPDEIAVLNVRRRPWPDRDEEVSCALFRFRYDTHWGIGIVGPFIFSKEFPEDTPIDTIYEEFERFYDTTIRAVVKRDLGMDLGRRGTTSQMKNE